MNITKLLIEKYNVRVEEIAYRLGASVSSVRNWWKGRTAPLGSYARRLEVMLKNKEGKQGP